MMKIIEFTEEHRTWAADYLRTHWGEPRVVTRKKVLQADELPGFIALWDGKPSGLVTYSITENQCEIVTLNSEVEGKGIGTALIETVIATARAAKCNRLWVITTNDNIEAIQFYQKRGFKLAVVHRNAIEHSRRLKPSIPLMGNHGIAVKDEIEFEKLLK